MGRGRWLDISTCVAVVLVLAFVLMRERHRAPDEKPHGDRGSATATLPEPEREPQAPEAREGACLKRPS